MKRFVRKAFTLFWVMVLIAACLPVYAFAAEEGYGILSVTEITPPVYEDAKDFSEGLAAVKKDGKWGFIDTDNNVVIPFKYDIAASFSEGLAIVGTYSDNVTYLSEEREPVEDQPGYIIGSVDRNGDYTQFYINVLGEDREFCVDQYYEHYFDYTSEYRYYNGYINIDGNIFDYTGKYIDFESDYGFPSSLYVFYSPTEGTLIGRYPDTYDVLIFNFDDKNKELNSIDVAGYSPEDIFEVYPFNQGLAPVGIYVDEEIWYRYGFIDKTGEFVIPPIYTSLKYNEHGTEYRFFGETGTVTVGNASREYGMIDKNGNVVIPFEYEYLSTYSEGLIGFMQDNTYGFLDDKGNVVIENKYLDASDFNNGLALAYDGEKYYIIDRKGNIVKGSENLDIENYFASSIYDSITEYMIIKEGDKYGFAKIEYKPELPQPEDMSSWAHPEVVEAIKENLVPVKLQNMYTRNINRKEFAWLVINLIEAVEGKDISDVVKEKLGKDYYDVIRTYPFIDSADQDVLVASALGIITGKGNRTFDPYADITRQEAAVMLARTANLLGVSTTGRKTDFADSGSIASWAKDGIDKVVELGIMNGTGNNRFDPLKNYTREQAIITIYRLFSKIK